MGGESITKDMIQKAMDYMKVPRSIRGQILSAILKTAISETGNRNIMQSSSTHDVNSGGNEARGPLQFTPGTFNTFAVKGHHNIMNPYDQVLAFLNNSDYKNATGHTVIWGTPKYDWLHSGPIGHPRGFENGGLVSHHQLAEIGEHNKPEMVIPLTNKSRSVQLLQDSINYLSNGSTGQPQQQLVQESESAELIKELRLMVQTQKQILNSIGVFMEHFDHTQFIDSDLATFNKSQRGKELYDTRRKITRGAGLA